MKSFWLFCFSVSVITCFGQPGDSVKVGNDSTLEYFSNSIEDEEDSRGISDSLKVVTRSFNPNTLNELKADESLQYKEAPTMAESLWDRFVALLGQFFDSIFQNAVTTNWGRFFSYVIGIALIVVLIMMLLRINAFSLFYSGHGASTMPYHVLHENIHEMDFEKLINEAIEQSDYRKAVRLLFLNALKTLADKNFIHWEQGKTNHDYLSELKVADLKSGFNELNYYFEYAWYGNFIINHDLFLKVQNLFTTWKEKVR